MQDMITISEAARRLGMSRSGVYKMFQRGLFPSAKRLSDRFVFIDPADLDLPQVKVRPRGYPKGRPRRR